LIQNRGSLNIAKMKTISLVCVTVLLGTGLLKAGPTEIEAKDLGVPPKITDPNDWHFTLGSPGWLAGVSGTVGLRGVNSHVDIDFDQLIRHADFLTSLSGEVRKGRFGIYSDFLYMELSDAVYPERALSKANINLSEYLLDGEAFYRVLECDRGYLDLRAGARYTDLYTSLKLFGNSRLIDQAATNLVNAVDGDLRHLIERILAGVDHGGGSRLPIPPLGAEEKLKLIKLIRAARMDPMTAQARIAKVLNKELNRTFSLTERWADPYIGVGGHYNLNKTFYVTGKVDVGGFGVGSDITTQAYGAVGFHLTHWSYTELGYRFLYADYEDDSNKFVWKTETQGVQLTSGIIF
jgi:hypothetical protein